MKVLIIDDSEYKINDLLILVEQWGQATEVSVARSFHGGVRALQQMLPDLVLLDMTLPTFEGRDRLQDGRTRIFGGAEILREMEFLEIDTKVIVVTQFDRFRETEKSVDLTTLLKGLTDEFPGLVVGGVYYSNTDAGWRSKLSAMLVAVGKESS